MVASTSVSRVWPLHRYCRVHPAAAAQSRELHRIGGGVRDPIRNPWEEKKPAMPGDNRLMWIINSYGKGTDASRSSLRVSGKFWCMEGDSMGTTGLVA